MKITDCLIIAFSLALSNNNALVLAFGDTLGNIKALTDWSNEVYMNMSKVNLRDKSIDSAAYLYIKHVINNKLTPEMERSTIRIDQIVNSGRCSLLQRLPAMRQCYEALKNLAINLDVIDRFHRDLVHFVQNENKINNVTLKRWATSTTSYAVGDLPDVLWKIHRSILPKYDFHEGLFMLISRTLQENNNDICDIGVSPQHCLYELYETVLNRQIKAYISTLYAYGYLQTFENGDFNAEMKIAKDEFDTTSEKLLKVVFESMKQVPRDLRRCDPKEHKRNSTFLELERFMQAYIINEVDTNSFGKCDNECSRLERSATQRKEYNSKSFKHNHTCDGDLISCNDGGSDLLVCQLPKDNVRRYAWFRNGYGINGAETNCDDGEIHRISDWNNYGTRCNYCICTCIQDKAHKDTGTIRKISFMDQMSNISQNMVVVGLKFISKYGAIHVQILQAPLLQQGGIDTAKLEWLPIKEFYYVPESSEGSDQNRYFIWTEDGGTSTPGKHYSAINRHQRQMNLDDILLPDNYAVTGVRFRYAEGQGESEHQPIRLEVHGTPFDYIYGKLVPTKRRGSMWFNAENMRNKYSGSYREEVEMKNPGNPLNYVNNLPNSKPNSYIKFTVTDVKKDAGQATVPFFDALQIGGKVNFPLSGIGIFHRGHPASGGFLAFRIYGIDLTKYMKILDEDYTESFVFRTNDEKDYF